MNFKKCSKCKADYNLMHRNWYGNDNSNPLCRFCGEEDAAQLRNHRWKKMHRTAQELEHLMIKRVVEYKSNVIYKTLQFKKIDAMPCFLSKARQ